MGSIINDDKKTADVMNNYFASVFMKEDLTNIPNQNFITAK